MPAIQMTRLRIQVARLLEHFKQPDNFARSLAEYLDFYADRTKRLGRLAVLGPIQKQYRVHPAVIKQLLDDLVPFCRTQPQAALALADTLWRDDHYEPRVIAAGILAMLPCSEVGLMFERLMAWAGAGEDRILIDLLLKNVAVALMRCDLKRGRKLILIWLKDPSLQQQSIGLRALTLYAEMITPDLYPDVFQLLTPLPVKPASYLLSDLESVFATLYKNSPGEMLFYLRQLAGKRQNPELNRLLRSCLNLLTTEDRESIRPLVE